MSLAGCASSPTRFATVKAFCNELPEQTHVIEGKTKHDQPWIDDTGEAVIAGCGRDRPKPRPPEWDRPAPKPAPAPPAAKKPAPRPYSIFKRTT